MRTVVLFSIFILLFVSCNPLKLTNKDAMRLIREAKGYPGLKGAQLEVPKNSKLVQEFKRLVGEGYLTQKDDYSFRATDKGKNLVYDAFWNDGSGWFTAYTHKFDIKRIIEILTDSENKTALVKYEIALFPTDYYYKLIELDKAAVENNSSVKHFNGFVEKNQIRLIKWDQGWRVVE